MSVRRRRNATFGQQVRSYVLNPIQRVTDHRTGHTESDVGAVLDGRLEGFIRAYLIERKRDTEKTPQ